MDKELHPVAFAAPIKFEARALTAAPGPHPCSGVAYGGGIITDHPLFPRVAFDLSSTKVEPKARIKRQHGPSIGQIDASSVDTQIRYSGHIYPHIKKEAQEVLDMAAEGFEWQASVGLYPGKMDKIAAGASLELNGRTMAGPLTVFRNNRIREISIVDLGADDSTSAQFFSIGDETAAPSSEQTQMDQVSKEEHDRIVGELQGKIAKQDETIKTVQASATQTAEALTAIQTELKARADADKARAAKDRGIAVEQLFKGMGLEFKAETAAPYLAMDEATFTAVYGHMKAAKPKAGAHLFSVQATDGTAAEQQTEMRTASIGDEQGVKAVQAQAGDIVGKALNFQAEQRKLGIEVSDDDAVMHVTAAAA